MALPRTLRLVSLPLGAAALGVEGLVLRGLGRDREAVTRRQRARTVARTRRVLGDLKGGALKAGQLLSTVEALFPADPEQSWREALTSLQESNPGMPWPDAEGVLVPELGAGWRGRFASFEQRPAAAASSGQVHRAVWADGRDVAVKIQYPGVREAILSDVRAFSVASRAAALVARGVAMPPLVAEPRTTLLEELDYRREAPTQPAFGADPPPRLRGDAHSPREAATHAPSGAASPLDHPEAVVPGVVLATSRVLVQ